MIIDYTKWTCGEVEQDLGTLIHKSFNEIAEIAHHNDEHTYDLQGWDLGQGAKSRYLTYQEQMLAILAVLQSFYIRNGRRAMQRSAREDNAWNCTAFDTERQVCTCEKGSHD